MQSFPLDKLSIMFIYWSITTLFNLLISVSQPIICNLLISEECADHKDLIARVAAGDTKYFEQCINAHVCKENLLASLRSRYLYVFILFTGSECTNRL